MTISGFFYLDNKLRIVYGSSFAGVVEDMHDNTRP